ncbi:MAG TPA: hypothetical protein VEF03_07550 [Candidatus Binataceae bacterium]|nr:hypothetical protein [Candidatus Binataceae bacterium]
MNALRVGMRTNRAEAPRHNGDFEAAHPLMPTQYYDLVARRHSFNGELRLLFAVLEDAIRAYVMNLNQVSVHQRRDFEEASAWIYENGQRDLFSFENLCAVFEIDPDALRKHLKMLNARDLPRRRLRSIGRRVPMSVPA